MQKIGDNIVRLKKYFRLIHRFKEIPVAELLSSNEALKDFGRLWKEHPNDMMALIAMMEYEFISGTNYSEEQVRAVKSVLAKLIKFFKNSSAEWEEYEKVQALKAKE